MISNTIKALTSFVDQNYYTTPTSQRLEISVNTKNKGIPTQWKFHYTHVLKIKNPTKAIESMDLTSPSPTYVKTLAKINNLSGDTLIVSNSHNIGNIRASKVVLLNSTVKNIVADDIFMVDSFVNGDVYAKKNLNIVCPLPPSGVESHVSYTSVDKTVSEIKPDKIVITKGTISNLEVTVNGQPRQGKVIFKGSGKLKSESKSEGK